MKKMKKITTLDDLGKDGKINIDDIAAEAEKKRSSKEKTKKSEKVEESNAETETKQKTEL